MFWCPVVQFRGKSQREISEEMSRVSLEREEKKKTHAPSKIQTPTRRSTPSASTIVTKDRSKTSTPQHIIVVLWTNRVQLRMRMQRRKVPRHKKQKQRHMMQKLRSTPNAPSTTTHTHQQSYQHGRCGRPGRRDVNA